MKTVNGWFGAGLAVAVVGVLLSALVLNSRIGSVRKEAQDAHGQSERSITALEQEVRATGAQTATLETMLQQVRRELEAQVSDLEHRLETSDAEASAPRVIAQGAALHGANGINFGPDGNLYIASFLGREIVVMSPHSGQIIDRLGPEAGVETPDDLIFGPDGSLYWTEVMMGSVGRMTPDGVVTKQFVALGCPVPQCC